MRALESACVDRGVNFQEGVEVLELLKQDGDTHRQFEPEIQKASSRL